MTGEARIIPMRDELANVQGLGEGLNAILSEIVAMLERLVESGESGQIDLKSLPLAGKEHARLKALLSEGEVVVELSLNGLTRCRETGFPGVWWVEHFNGTGTVAAEFIEVAIVPEIVMCQRDEIRDGIARLSQQFEMGGSQEESNDER